MKLFFLAALIAVTGVALASVYMMLGYGIVHNNHKVAHTGWHGLFTMTVAVIILSIALNWRK